MTQEVQMDGLIGPTHFFGGLGAGNVASKENAGRVSYPKAAALQGLKKMKLVHDMGHTQLVMPPHARPALGFLEALGFTGNAAEKISAVSNSAPELLPIAYSSSAMWAANAATITPSAEAENGRVHFTPANLISNAHRALEAEVTAAFLKRIFPGNAFQHHAPLPYNPLMSDEGAANHMRVENAAGSPVHIFVYGAGADAKPKKLTARQHYQASKAIARRHQLESEQTIFLQQHPDAIDAGVFHNDVIATSNGNTVFYHEKAYVDDAPLRQLAEDGFRIIRVEESALNLQEAVKSYLFNSQILTQQDGSMLMIAPLECERSAQASALIHSWIAAPQNPFAAVQYIDVGQSMGNGGGPACLRLRIMLQTHELAQVHRGVVLNNALYEKLTEWVESHYPEQLTAEDLQDAALPERVQHALLELETILDLKGLYHDYF